jgi:hypothetical protein
VDPDRTAVAEGDIEVRPVSGLQASLTPVTSTGRWRGSHSLKVENWGNAPARLRIVASDPDQALGFLVAPPLLEVPVGGQGYARVKVRTRHPVLRGTKERHPFKVVGEPDGAPGPQGPLAAVSTPERPVLDGGFNQKPILDRWVVLAAGLLVLGIIALATFLLTRGDSEEEPPDPVELDAPQGVTADPAQAATVVLSWDAATGVDGYKVVQTRPTALEQEVSALYDPDNATRYLVRLKVDTADTYCYQLLATRKSGEESPPSEPEACTPTPTVLPAGATPAPTPGPITQLPPQEGEVEAPLTPSPSPDPATTPPTTSPSPTPTETNGPQRYVSVLKVYSGPPSSPPTIASDAMAALNALDVQAKLLHTFAWSLEPALPLDGWVLYVDAATPEELAGDCDTIVASHPDAALQHQIQCTVHEPAREVTARPVSSPAPST